MPTYPWDQDTASRLVDAGHLDPAILEQMKSQDAPAADPGFAPDAAQPDTSDSQPSDFDTLKQHFADQMNGAKGMDGSAFSPDQIDSLSSQYANDALTAQSRSANGAAQIAQNVQAQQAMAQQMGGVPPEMQTGPMIASNSIPKGALPGVTAAQEGAAGQGLAPGKKVDPSQLALAGAGTQPADTSNPMGDYLKSMKDANAQQLQGIQGMAGAQERAANAKVQVYDNLNANFAQNQKDSAALEQKFQASNDQYMAEIKKRNEDAEKASQIDPKRVWHDMSSGNKILAAISIGLGSVAGAMTGQGGNAALDIINKAIDRDIDAQKMTAQSKRQAVTDEMNLYSMNMRAFGDQRIALQATRSQMLQAAQAQVSSVEAKMGGQQAGAQAQMLMGQLKAQQSQTMANLQMLIQERTALSHVASGGAVSAQQLPMLKEDWQKRAVAMPDGNYKFGLNEKAAEKTTEFTQKYTEAKGILSELQGLKFAAPGTTDAKYAQQLIGKLKPAILGMDGITRFSDPDNKILLDPMVADPTAFLSGRNHKLLDNLGGILDRQADSVYGANVLGYHSLKLGAPKPIARK